MKFRHVPAILIFALLLAPLGAYSQAQPPATQEEPDYMAWQSSYTLGLAPGALRAIPSWPKGTEIRQQSLRSAQSQTAASGEVPASLQQKLHQLLALVEKRQQEGVDVEPVANLMQDFQPLMQEQKFSEAEALLDRALKIARDLAPPTTPQAWPPPWLREMMRHVEQPTASDPNYLVYQFMGDSQHPEQAGPWVAKLQADFGRQKPGQAKYIGFGFFIQDMNDDAASLREKIETLLGFAEKYDMPVFIQMDGSLFWDRRADGLPDNPEAVEWSAFPAPGQKTGPPFKRTWFNWGQMTSLSAAPPCFESPLFRADVKERLEADVAAPIRAALARWRAGPVDRTYLFAGVTVGNEVLVPDYRPYRLRQLAHPNAPPPRDARTGVEMTDAEMVRGGYCSLSHRGYTTEKIREIVRQRAGAHDTTGAATDAVITELLDGVVHDYMAFRAKILWDGLAGTGSAQRRIYTHTTATFREQRLRSRPLEAESIPTIAATVNPYSRPGFTVVRNVVDLPDVQAQMRAATSGATDSSLVPWGAVESYATFGQPGPPQNQEQYRGYLEMLFGSGAKLVSLLEAPVNPNNPFTAAAESSGVKSAIKDWVNSVAFPDMPAENTPSRGSPQGPVSQ